MTVKQTDQLTSTTSQDSESLDLEMLAEVIDSLHETYQTLQHNQVNYLS